MQAHSFGGKDGFDLQQIYEAGEPFEQLIDHPRGKEKGTLDIIELTKGDTRHLRSR